MKKNIALIGCGRIGYILETDPLRNKPCTHYGGIQSQGLNINYACDINDERLSSFSEALSILPENRSTNYKDIISANRPELVIIATWTQNHHEIARYAAQNGARVLVLEKPIASNLSGAKKIIDECRKNRVHLIINHERRYDSRYRKVKELIFNGKIGAIKTVHASILTGTYSGNSPIEEGGGPLLHDGTHIIDIIRFFFGEIVSVQGEFSRNSRKSGFEDKAAAWLKTGSGIDIFLEAGGNRKYFVFELEISGAEGKIIIGNGYEKLYLTRKSKFYTGFRDLESRPFPRYKQENCFKNLYAEAKSLLQGKDIPITSTGMDGYKALETIHAIYHSALHNGKKITLPINPGLINLKKIFNLK
ncbi:MAG: Gfo/Idh/MocA family oxidoreductase [bacterium]|nr:Gfo/Idh/MocA family oxidoreductase [bacterium]